MNEWYKTEAERAAIGFSPANKEYEPPKPQTQAEEIVDILGWEVVKDPDATIAQKLDAARIIARLLKIPKGG